MDSVILVLKIGLFPLEKNSHGSNKLEDEVSPWTFGTLNGENATCKVVNPNN